MAAKKEKKYFRFIWMLMLIIMSSAGYFTIVNEQRQKTPVYIISIENNAENVITADDSDALYTEENNIDINEPSIETSVVLTTEVSKNPKLAIIINDMGLNENLTNAVNDAVNKNISFALSPYSRNLEKTADISTKSGREIYSNIIIKSKDINIEDNGPKALAFDNSTQDIEILSDILNNTPNTKGVVIRGSIDENETEPVKNLSIESFLEFLADNDLILIDATDNEIIGNITHDNLKRIRADVIINGDATRENIINLINLAGNIAKEQRKAILVIDPRPINILLLNDWIKNNQDIDIIPISTLLAG